MLAIAADAEALLALPAGRRRASARWPRLIDRVADEGVLAVLAPRGRIPDDFPLRALRESRKRLDRCRRQLALALAARSGAPGPPEVGRVLVERGLTIVEGKNDRGFESRVRKAMTLLDAAWPDAAAMICGRTWRVVPVTAWATVSYSSARKPGIAYVNVKSSPLVRLAEDLVHETTHIRLHEIESLHDLIGRGARETDGSEPRFYSPWRREWRPLRGLVHAACTFTAGEVFFERMLEASDPRARAVRISAPRRLWLARRLLEERASVAMALAILRGAARRGLLTSDGRRVVQAAAREHRASSPSASARKRWLRGSAAGRRELARLARFVASLRKRPVRWSWENRGQQPN